MNKFHGEIMVLLYEPGAVALLRQWRAGLDAWQVEGWRVRIWAASRVLDNMSAHEAVDVMPIATWNSGSIGHGPVMLLSDGMNQLAENGNALCFSAALKTGQGDWAPAWHCGLPDCRVEGVADAMEEYRLYLSATGWLASTKAAELLEHAARAGGIGIYGRGMVGRTARMCADAAGIKTLCWIDSDPCNDGMEQDGIAVRTPQTALDVPVIFAAGAADVMADAWARAGRSSGYGLSVLHYACGVTSQPEIFWMAHALANRGRYLALLGLLDSSASVQVLTGIFAFRRTLNNQVLWRVKSAATQWFDPDYFKADQIHSLVDCGAYNGDTALSYLALVPDGAVVCIEPDERLAAEASANPALASHNVVQAAAGSDCGEALFLRADGMSGALAIEHVDGEKVMVTTVDTWLDSRAEMIKLDVEGQELQALAGSVKTIANGAFIAVAAYHLPGDLVDIATVLTSARNTAIGLRHYTALSFETVLYTTKNNPLSVG